MLPAPGEAVHHAVSHGKDGAHIEAHVFGIQRGCTAQAIAADIAEHNRILALGQFKGKAAVRTAGAENRRTGDDSFFRDRYPRISRTSQGFLYDIRIEFAYIGDNIVSVAGDAGGFDFVFHERVQFFHDVQRIYFFRKGTDFLHGKGIGKTNLQDRYAVAKYFFYIVVSGTGRDNAHIFMAFFFHVPGTGFGIRCQIFFPLFDDDAAFAGNSRYGIHFFRLFHIGDGRHFYTGPFFDEALGVADTGRHADHDRRMEPFADGVGIFGHILGFLGIGRFKHAYFGKFGIIAVILFVLG